MKQFISAKSISNNTIWTKNNCYLPKTVFFMSLFTKTFIFRNWYEILIGETNSQHEGDEDTALEYGRCQNELYVLDKKENKNIDYVRLL